MPDLYAIIGEVDPVIQEQLAGVLELRAADPQQRAMLDDYLSQVTFPAGARVLEVGCGTGPVTRVLARQPGVAEAVGVDPSPIFIAKARELGAGLSNLAFEQADGRALRFERSEFDVVVFHTTLCHVVQPERALAEAFRVLRPRGTLAVCDGDYATITVALSEHDPLQVCIEAVKVALLNDPWLVRRLPTLLRTTGFELLGSRSYSYVQTKKPEYMLTLVNRGADTLASTGRIGSELSTSLKAEAQRRAEAGEFFGFIAFASFIARRPG